MRMLAKLMRPIERQSLKRESGTWDYEEGEYKPGGINDSTKGMGMEIGQSATYHNPSEKMRCLMDPPWPGHYVYIANKPNQEFVAPPALIAQ